jgi:hypothetical protein
VDQPAFVVAVAVDAAQLLLLVDTDGEAAAVVVVLAEGDTAVPA